MRITLYTLALGLRSRFHKANKNIMKRLTVLYLIAIFLSFHTFAAEDSEKSLSQMRSYTACLNCDLSGVDLSRSFLHQSSLRGSQLVGADLRWSYFEEVNLRRANLKGADLRHTVLNKVDMRHAKLSLPI